MKLLFWSLLLLMSLGGFQSCIGARFLVPSVTLLRTPSHQMTLSTITQALVQRGHEVIFLIIDNQGVGGFLPDSYTSKVILPNPMTDQDLQEFSDFINSVTDWTNVTKLEALKDPRPWKLKEYANFGCSVLFENTAILEQLRLSNFDELITYPAVDVCDTLLAAYLDIPFIVVTGTKRVPAFHEGMLGIPSPVSYVPFSILFTPELGHRMTFFERVTNTVMFYGLHNAIEYLTVYRHLRHLQRTYGIRPDLTPWQIISKADLWLCHNTWALEYPRPIAPNWIPIGGLTIKEPRPLPEDLERFIQGSGDHGFIVFTLGSMVNGLPSDALNDIISKVFSELPQRILWRYLGEKPRYLGNNTLISEWLPQNDLLAHPKARLLIYHGGSAGVYEAMNYGVPMLLMPLGFDQFTNAHQVAAKGMGFALDVTDLSEHEFGTSINKLLNDKSYMISAQRASSIMRDQLASPLETAVFWIEHVIKFGGDHLRLRSTEMGFIELNSLDVVAFLVVLSLILLYIDYLALRGCYKCVCRNMKKQKTD
ncbi:UDP-glucuronosyltransferase 2B17-like [Lytechinus variegatus]|uniref:UDP-glucuronosyltransferase 2B17-like n=1 Tax=Lytechinus variegatus TaxID=7654 RepID=UPI001BB28608|nr:UDP-glucuronosyltransferase 2B17-like [Lytechinus variegatus]